MIAFNAGVIPRVGNQVSGKYNQRSITIEEETPAAENSISLQEVIDLWNEKLSSLGVRKVSKVTPGRQLDFNVRCKADPARSHRGFWAAVVEVVAKSSFLRNASWFGFDWLIGNEERLTKLTEGQYDDRVEDGWGFERVEGNGSGA